MVTTFDGNRIFTHPYALRGQDLLHAKQAFLDGGIRFDHDLANQVIRSKFRLEAQQRELNKNAHIKCMNRGHNWRVRSQSAWDAGYDEPVFCTTCGEWDM